ncbi:hypothetical protein EV356DRAFT_442599 [Viridothelium virens]|uniref:DNA-directed RNA polymerase subunit n=1 Tax=Viridothelium virens TaxID=1048519 RepID=A0A6A6HGX8_VIRVR|nr:hypothetical protein EV356DRAFT_442599 [Viridothelium virens]
MALVGSLLFCTDCGNLLDRQPPAEPKIICATCNSLNKNRWPSTTVTTSKPSAFPSSLRQKRGDIQTVNAEDIQTWATTQTTCPNCDNPETLFKEQQLRSADEGTTVFYYCEKCKHRYVGAVVGRF